MNDVIDEIIELYYKHHVVILEATCLSSDVPDIADIGTKQVVININSKYKSQLPFRLAHELMHIVHSNFSSHRMVAYHNYDVRNPEEKIANSEAVKLLVNLYAENVNEMNWVNIMNAFGIPTFLENEVKEAVANVVR